MIYFVTFDVHRNCQVREIIFHCEAKNAKEAKEIARQQWMEGASKPAYQFHLYAKKSAIQNTEYLRVIDYLDRTRTGNNVMEHFICTNCRTWRANERNLYGN